MPKVFVSDAIHQQRLIFGPAQPPGLKGWAALSALYQASLAACGYRIEPVIRPEIYQAGLARQVLGVAPGDWHLAVKPIEHIRPFHGIPNVFVCDWRFPELSASSYGVSPFFDQVRLLRQADAVLCCTGFAAQVLRDAGIERVITLPPCIPSPVLVRSGPPERQSFLLLADGRPLGRVVEAFAQAQARQHDLHLAVCTPDAASLGPRVLETVGRRTLQTAVSFLEPPADWTELLGSADFFLCDSPASGLHLPMVQAMLAGVPLVTTANSGIGSVLSPDAAIPIATHSAAADGEAEPVARHMHLTCNPATIEGVRDAILAAADLDALARAHMARIARGIAERKFGLAAFKAGLAGLGQFVP